MKNTPIFAKIGKGNNMTVNVHINAKHSANFAEIVTACCAVIGVGLAAYALTKLQDAAEDFKRPFKALKRRFFKKGE